MAFLPPITTSPLPELPLALYLPVRCTEVRRRNLPSGYTIQVGTYSYIAMLMVQGRIFSSGPELRSSAQRSAARDCFPLPDEERGLILDTECRPGSYLARVGRFMARFQFGSALLWVALELRCLRSCSTGHPAARPVRPLRLGWSRTPLRINLE